MGIMMRVLWVTLICLLQLIASQECDTENGWNEMNGKCFRVSRNAAETQYTWQEAREACLAEGGDIATIMSEAEQNFVISLATDIGFAGTLWIGLNQLADKDGDFVWADGSDSSYDDWGDSEPRDGGITNCAFSLTQPVAGAFQRYDYSTALYGLLDPGYDRPTDADGVDTFYFGGGYDKDQDWCENMCKAETRCAAYTWYWYHWDYYWQYTCVGRSDRWDIIQYDSYGYAGVRDAVGDDGEGWWYAGNCGLNKGFACTKQPGSDTPVTVPPTASVDGYCPPDYIGIDNKCLKVVIVEDEQDGQMWQQAMDICRAGPGISPDIASIHSDAENALVTHQLQSTTYGLWIGYHYATMHKTWVWADNTEPRYSNWGQGQPADTTNLCVEMQASISTAGEWHNLRCDSRRGYVCQTYKDPDNIIETPPPTTPHQCADGWTPYWYGCYRYDATARTWAAARDNCESLGGHLVSIHHEAENAAVYLAAEKDYPIWIGLSTDENGFYEWADGWPYGYYMNWDDNAVGGGEGCVVMKSNQKWNDTICSDTHASVCKQTDAPVPTTPEGATGYCPLGDWLEFGPNCYYFSTTTFDHASAMSDCRTQGGSSHAATLATIENIYENEWILDQLKGNPYNDGTWIGLIRSQTGDDGFAWLDGSDSDFRHWAPGEPSDPYYENCVEMWVNQWPGMWNDARCDYSDYIYRYYVCKAAKGDMPTTPQMPSPGDQECPSGNWDVWGNNCVLVRPNDYRNWDDALSLCKQMGGTNASLASIHSYEENWYIHQKVVEYNYDDYYNPDVWIGMSKRDYGYPYVWENERPVDYTHWAPGEPNDIDGSQNCVRMYHASGQWDDYYCYDYYYHGYVCQVRQDLFKKELAEKGPNFFKKLEDIPPNPLLVGKQPTSRDHARDSHTADASSSNKKSGKQAGIIIGCLLGIVVTAALISLVVIKKVNKTSKTEEVAMENVIATPPDANKTCGYDQQENA